MFQVPGGAPSSHTQREDCSPAQLDKVFAGDKAALTPKKRGMEKDEFGMRNRDAIIAGLASS